MAQQGSPMIRRNFGRLANTREFRLSTVTADTYGGGTTPATSSVAFSAAGAYDKVLTLALVTLVTGIAAYAVKLAPAFMLLSFPAAILGWVTIFRPTIARVTAPIFALCQGIFLGTLSWWAVTRGVGAVALALLGTIGIYFAALGLYRTRMVRVTPTFLRITVALGFGTIFAAIGAMVFSWLHVPVLSATISGPVGIYLIFGVMYLVVGILNLFADFNFIEQADHSGTLNRQGEWFAALMVLWALVMIFLGLLRVLGAMNGGSRR